MMEKSRRSAGWLKAVRSGTFGVYRKTFAVYVGFTLGLFGAAGLWGAWQSHVPAQPSSAMKRLAASVPGRFFIDMIGLEAPHLARPEGSTFAGKRVVNYLAGELLHVNPFEPKSLLAGELPGLKGHLTASAGIGAGGAPDQASPQDKPSVGNKAGGAVPKEEPPAKTDGSAQPAPLPNADTGGTVPASKLSTQGRKVVFIYHSHPRESWVPELGVQKEDEAMDAQKNVTLIGKRLMEKLEEAGIGAVHSATDYQTTVPGYNWNYSYKYSLQTVREAFAANQDIKFLFDIHRDGGPSREATTAQIDGKDFARVYFIVGKKNQNWEKNQAFAKKINDLLEAKYPGLSRGIWDKGSGGHAEYNQSVSPNSILIEVGGAYSTLEESYRTADILAKVIAELYWDAEKVNAPATASASARP